LIASRKELHRAWKEAGKKIGFKKYKNIAIFSGFLSLNRRLDWSFFAVHPGIYCAKAQ